MPKITMLRLSVGILKTTLWYLTGHTDEKLG